MAEDLYDYDAFAAAFDNAAPDLFAEEEEDDPVEEAGIDFDALALAFDNEDADSAFDAPSVPYEETLTPEEPPEDPSMLDRLSAGFESIGGGMQKTAGVIASEMGYEDVGTALTAVGEAHQMPAEEMAYHSKYGDFGFEAWENLTDGDWWQSMLPQLATGSAPFLGGAAAGFMAGSFAGPVGQIVGAMLGGGGALMAQTYGDNYHEYLGRNPGDVDKAHEYAMKKSGTEAIVNAASIPLGIVAAGALPVVAGQTLKQGVGSLLLKLSGTEVATENLDNTLGNMIDAAYIDPNTPLSRGWVESTVGGILFDSPAIASGVRNLSNQADMTGKLIETELADGTKVTIGPGGKIYTGDAPASVTDEQRAQGYTDETELGQIADKLMDPELSGEEALALALKENNSSGTTLAVDKETLAQNDAILKQSEEEADAAAEVLKEEEKAAPDSHGIEDVVKRIDENEFGGDPEVDPVAFMDAAENAIIVTGEELGWDETKRSAVLSDLVNNREGWFDAYNKVQDDLAAEAEQAEKDAEAEEATEKPLPKTLSASELEPVDVRVDDLELSDEVPQFKFGADEEGIVRDLGGKFNRVGLPPIQIWERLDGRLQIISGRHRWKKAKESGEETMPAQIFKESDGFTAVDAAIMDAELNIQDEKGSVADYVNYFRHKEYSPEEADARGLLGATIGKRAYSIASTGSEELIAAHQAGEISDTQADAISKNAPGEGQLQQVAMKAIMNGKSTNEAVNTMRAVRSTSSEGQLSDQGNIFGEDDSFMIHAEEMAKVAGRKQLEIAEKLRAVQGASKNPKAAADLGVDVKDEAALKKAIADLKAEKLAWEKWDSNPEMIAEINAEMSGEPLTLTQETEEERQTREAAEKEAEGKPTLTKDQADMESDQFELGGEEAPAEMTPEARSQQDLLAGETKATVPTAEEMVVGTEHTVFVKPATLDRHENQYKAQTIVIERRKVLKDGTVIGIGKDTETGETVSVDTKSGKTIFNPTEEQIRAVYKKQKKDRLAEAKAEEEAEEEAEQAEEEYEEEVDYFEDEDFGDENELTDIGDDIPQMSTTGELRKGGISKKKAEGLIAKNLKAWADAGVTVKVIGSNELLGLDIRQPEGKIIKGFIKDNTAYIVHDNLSSARDAEVQLAHEAIGHFGINNIVADWDVLKEAYQSMRQIGGTRFQSIHDEVMRRYTTNTISTASDQRGEITRKIPLDLEIKEFLAIAAERREKSGSIGRFYRKAVNAIVKGLKAKGYISTRSPFSMTEIDTLLDFSEESLRGEYKSTSSRLAGPENGFVAMPAVQFSVEGAKKATTADAEEIIKAANPAVKSRLSSAKAVDELRKSLNRPRSVGEQENKRITRSVNGKQEALVGKPTPQQWVNRVERILTTKEIAQSREWYREVLDVFAVEFGAANAQDMATAWLLSNQNIDPAGAMGNALRVFEQVKTGAKGKRGGLSHNLTKILFEGGTPTKGIGPKLHDFVDSALGKITRTWMGDTAEGGSPVVVDIHTSRDMGYVDPAHLKRLIEKYGAKKLEGVVIDHDGAPGPTQYEHAAQDMRELTVALNKKGWMNGNLTALEVQAIGWTAMAREYGSEAFDATASIERNTRQISYEVEFGEGSPFLVEHPAYEGLPADQKAAVTEKVMNDILAVARDIVQPAHRTGNVPFYGPGKSQGLGERGTGQTKVTSSREAAEDMADIVGYLAQQSEVSVVRPMPSESNKHAFDITGIPHNKIDEFWERLTKILPRVDDTGYAPIIRDGVEGLRSIRGSAGKVEESFIESEAAKALEAKALNASEKTAAKLRQKASDTIELRDAIEMVEKEMSLKVKYEGLRVEQIKRKNNWNRSKQGNGYLQGLRKRYGPSISGRLLSERGKISEKLGQEIQKAQSKKSRAKPKKKPDLDTQFSLEEGEEYHQPVDSVYTWDDFAADVNKQTDTGVFLIPSGMSESSYMDIPSLKDYGVDVRFSSHDDRHPTDGRINIESTVLERINGQYGTKGVAQALSELSAKLDKEKPTLDKRAAEIDSAIEDYDAALDENIDRIRLDSDNFLRNWGGDTALKSRAAFDPDYTESPNISRSQDNAPAVREGFFSGLSHAVSNLKQTSGPARQMFNTLKKMHGVKQAEIEALDLEEFIDAHKGKLTVEELQAYVDGNGIQIETTRLGEISEEERHERTMEKVAERTEFRVRARTGKVYAVDKATEETLGDDYGEDRYWEEEEDALDELAREYIEHTGAALTTAHYGKGSLIVPGGENYREILLSLPERGTTMPEGYTAEEIPDNDKGWWKVTTPTGREMSALNERRALVRANIDAGVPRNYESGHYGREKPNVIMHMRVDDRTTSNGERILFIEEIQSDWHQKGKDSGYKETVTEKTRERKKKTALDLRNKLKEENNWGYDTTFQAMRFIRENEEYDSKKDATPETIALAKEHKKMHDAAWTYAPPDGPFKGNDWVALGLKKALRMAAEGGYDQVAWTDGQTQADRYRLEEHVEKIAYQKNDDGTYKVFVTRKGAGPDAAALDRVGGQDMSSVPEKKMAGIFGKELTEKIVNGEQDKQWGQIKVLSGLDLNVGGKGMKNFYDRLVPNLMKDAARKLDKKARLGTTSIQTREAEAPTGPPSVDSIIDWREPPETALEVQTIPITDKMRQKAMEGQTLFSQENAPETEKPVSPVMGGIQKAISEMKLPQWAAGKSARGREILRKISRLPGIKKGELESVGLDDILSPDQRYTREEVMSSLGMGDTQFSEDEDSRYTPEQDEAITHGGGRTQGPPTVATQVKESIQSMVETFKDLSGVKEMASHGAKVFRQGMVDQYASFNSVLKSDKTWKMANMTNSAVGAMQVLMGTAHKGKVIGAGLIMEDGAIGIKEGSKSFQELAAPLKGELLNKWLWWQIGHRAEKLKGQTNEDGTSKEKHFTDQQIAALKTLNKGNEQMFEDVRKDFEELQNSVYDMAIESGLIDKKQAMEWRNDGFYVPFYRVLMEEANVAGPRMIGGSDAGLIRQKAFKELTGRDSALKDPLANVMSNWHHLISATLKNNAANAALNSAQNMVTTNGVPLAKKINRKGRGSKSIFTMVNGQEQWWNIDESPEGKLVLDSLTALNWNGLNNGVMKTTRAFKRALTFGVTLSPEFKIANLLRDSIQAMAVANMSVNPAKNIYQGWQATDKEGKTYLEMLAGGGIFGDAGYVHGGDKDAIDRLMSNGVGRDNILDSRNKIKNMLRKLVATPYNKYQDLGVRGENVNRAANYVQSTGNRLDRNFEARDHLAFDRTGSSWAIRYLSQTVPFLNARLQGLDKNYRAAVDPNQKKQWIGVTTAYAAASVVMYLSMKDDEDYKEREQWERDAYHLFKIPGDPTGTLWALPRPFEVGAFATIAERVVEQFADDEANLSLLGERLGHVLLDTFAFNPVPQIAKPYAEVMTNTNWYTGRRIESLGMDLQNLPATSRKRPWTSPTAIKASEAMGAVMHEKLTFSPVQIEHLTRGYLGWLGASAIGLADTVITRPLTDAPTAPSMTWRDYPIIKRFAKDPNPNNTKYTSLFYERGDEISMVAGAIRQARENQEWDKAERLMKKNNDIMGLEDYYNKQRLELGKLNRRMKIIHSSTKKSGPKKTQELSLIKIRKAKLTKIIHDATKDNF